MILSWLTCSLNFTMISFMLKYFPGDIFFNGLMSCSSELLAYWLSCYIYQLHGAKSALFWSYAIAAIGGASILIYITLTGFYEKGKQIQSIGQIILYGILILITKFGISAAFNICYVSNSEMFPPLFSVTAFGISNFFARSSTFFAPQIAEIQSTFPMMMFTSLSIAAMISS